MNRNTKAYLFTLYHELRKLSEGDRMDAVREIESHIEEGMLNGQSEEEILAKLGDPRKLAKAYRNEHIMQQGEKRSLQQWLAILSFYCTDGLASVIVVPVLATFAYGFGFGAILVFLAGIIRTFGVTWIQMDIGPGISVPTELSMVYSLVVGGFVGSIAYFSRKYLRIYLKFLSKRYRTMLPRH